MIGFGPRPGASGGDVIGAPKPSAGKGASPTSLPPALAGTGTRAGSGAVGGAGLRRSGPEVERFPNTVVSASRLAALELFEERGQQASPRTFHLGAPSERLRETSESLRRAMSGRHFGNHLSIVGSRAEQLRLERDRCDRLEFQRLGKIARLDLGTFGHAHHVQAILRTTVVWPARTQEVDQVLCVAQ